jgi:hypothetical protein
MRSLMLRAGSPSRSAEDDPIPHRMIVTTRAAGAEPAFRKRLHKHSLPDDESVAGR